MDNILNPMLIYWHMANASKCLAENVASLRGMRGLSQKALSELAGLPRSTVTHIESGSGNPSLTNLVKLAGALQVSIEELLKAPRPECRLVKFALLPRTKRGGGLATIYELLPDHIPGMQIDRMEIAPRGRIGGIPHLAGTREYFTCLAGAVRLTVAGQPFDLGEGDVLAFPGDRAHSYHNPGTKAALGISVVSLVPPGV